MELPWTLFWLVLAVEAAPCENNQQCASCYNDGRCLSQCTTGYYGYECKHKCNPGCKHDVCHLTTAGDGKCTYGCKSGFYGTRCSIPCETHVNTCRKCPQECEGGFCQLGSSCAQGCQDSYYGTACRSCPAGCEVCNRVSGTCEVCLHCEGDCTRGCLEGCTTGYFGDFCEHPCSSACLTGCNQTSGDCFGCKSGWFGTTCDKQCPKCLDEECDIDGICTRDCIEGWYGPRCDSNCGTGCIWGRCDRNGTCINGCKLGFYGEHCKNKCPENCFNKFCHGEDGACRSCQKDFYGLHCDKSCARCVDGSCRQNTGHCIQECLSNYTGEFCQHDCGGNCTTDECRDVCKTVYETNKFSGEDYLPYWVAAAVVVIVAVLVMYAACRFKRLQRVIHSMKGEQRQEHQPQRDQTEAPAEPNVHFYCEVDEDVMTPSRLPRVCTAQASLAGNAASQETSSQSRQDADQEGTPTSPEPMSSNTDASDQTDDAPVQNEAIEGNRMTADSVQRIQSNRNSYLTAFAPNIDEGSDTSPPENADMSSAEPQEGCLTSEFEPSHPLYISDAHQEDHVSVTNTKALIDDGSPLNDDATGVTGCEAAAGIHGYGRARGFGTHPPLVITESAEDGEVDEEMFNISVPVIADCYDNFSVDDNKEAIPVPPHENYSELFTTNYAFK